MTSAAIDLDTLNELFETQKKLNDVFNSVFDEDYFLISSRSSNDHELGSRDQKSSQDLNSNEDLSFNAEDRTFVQKKRRKTYFIMPVVVEIVAVSYCIFYFT